MKKLFTLLLISALLVAFLFPGKSFALENQGLENAISTAKTLLNITDEYDNFNYSISKQEDRTLFNLSWKDSKNKLGEINTSIDSSGKIFNYYSYSQYDSTNRIKLPSITRDAALGTANEFIKKVNLPISGEIKYKADNSTKSIMDSSYNFYYERMENNVLFPNNNVNVSVDNRTGKVQSFYTNWGDGLSFPDTNGVITVEKAQQAFTDKLGLKLVYRISYDSEEPKPYLAYNYIYNNKTIDAKTGDVLISDYYYMNEASQKSLDAGKGESMSSVLSPEERESVENLSNFMDENEAEQAVRNALNLNSSYSLDSINLYRVWQTEADYMWSISFVVESTDESSYYSASASIDAKTGEMLNFYKSGPYDPNAIVKYTKEQSLKLAEDYIKSIQSEKFNQAEYTNWDEPIVKPMENSEEPRQYYFTFTRKSNNAYFPGNGFNLTVDTTTGSIISYNLTWYRGELPSTNGIVTLGKAHEVLFDAVGLQLQYIPDNPVNAAQEIMPRRWHRFQPNTTLVYTIMPGRPVNIDAVSGNLLDFSGKPYNEEVIPEYTDISGNYAENQIKILAQYGISLPGTEFTPDQVISEREFLYMLAKSIGFNNSFDPTDAGDEALFNFLSSMGVIKESEKAFTSTVTRQDAVKFIIRALRYDRVADISDIFKLPFNDALDIKPELYGYIAIAYGLNIIKDDGGAIKPVDDVTKAGAAILTYNLLYTGY